MAGPLSSNGWRNSRPPATLCSFPSPDGVIGSQMNAATPIVVRRAGRSGRSGRSSRSDFERAVIRAISDLLAGPSPNPNIVAVADHLSVSVRTLQRRLESDVPFRTLLNECRWQSAIEKLTKGQQPVSEVATGLGYSDPAHFARAFRRWTGHSPSEYRRRMLHGQDPPP